MIYVRVVSGQSGGPGADPRATRLCRAGACRTPWLDVPVTSVVTLEAVEQVLGRAAGYAVLEAGEVLHAAGRVTRARPACLGVSGTVLVTAQGTGSGWVSGSGCWSVRAIAPMPARWCLRGSIWRRWPPGRAGRPGRVLMR